MCIGLSAELKYTILIQFQHFSPEESVAAYEEKFGSFSLDIWEIQLEHVGHGGL